MHNLQCLRRLLEEKDAAHGVNGLKYLSTIAAVALRTIYEFQKQKTTTWQVLAAATSGMATLFNTHWDIVIDWGLLRRKSSNPWLRDKLVLPHKVVYFVAIVRNHPTHFSFYLCTHVCLMLGFQLQALNCVLRLVWMQQVLGIQTVLVLHGTALSAVVASLEIIRRGIWNFFRYF